MTAIIENKVRLICDKRSLDRDGFIGLCLQSKVRIDGQKLKASTAARIFDGATDITLRNASLVAAALQVNIGDVFTIK